MKPRRVLIGLTEIAGYNASLKRGFEELGVPCTFLNQRAHPFRFGGDDAACLPVRLQRWANARLDASTSLPVRALFYAIIQACNIPLFIRVLATHDVFIFGYGSTFLGYFDLPILRLFGKRIIYVFFGSDERPPYLDGALMGPGKGRTVSECIRLTARQKQKIRRIERYADLCVSHPASAHLHERPFVQWLAVGVPFSPPPDDAAPGREASGSVRILHSPSDPEAKGSGIIRSAIRELQEKGYAIEYVEITNRPHAVVLEELRRCDFVVDQVYSDTPMAMFATEVAAFGRPAVVGGYYADRIREAIPEDLIPPSLYCHPDRIAGAIELLVRDDALRADLGRRAQQYVRERWEPRRVAERYLRLIDGDVPGAWCCDPQAIRYLHGVGFSETHTRSLLRAVIAEGGIAALQVPDKPDLEDLFCEFARNGSSQI
ncbi:glycosyltransferase family 4 protein [Methanoculleus sp. FWC-SCC1]|uniref:Glycosyltransferase family 4 protein n=1 Tax=Methanoculleus frigidifontis TaxID=2584085 RepID=A0ABT8M7N7_9EURY|nr:hypothetical protein [Methanoculleus sp. FWC-SCC1]MDN7023947.1 glycosyltransferase family 4 protein [Methanoculleus sp. FWC-SCC1]